MENREDADKPRLDIIVEPGLDVVVEQIGDTGWSDEYWNSLFEPLRGFLIKKLLRRYRHLHRDDITDAADEIIFRLCRNFDFARLAEVPRGERRVSFYSFVKHTVRSVIADIHAQKGLAPIRLPSKPAASPVVAPDVPAEIVARAFRSLSPEEQEILRFRVFQRLSYREVQARCAERGTVPTIPALKMRSSRATRALRQVVMGLLGTRGE